MWEKEREIKRERDKNREIKIENLKGGIYLIVDRSG